MTPDLCSFIVDRLNDDFVPAVPRRGIGCAGEVIPLSHAFQTFLGVGQVITSEGRLQDARTALAERGVAPYEPGVKEGVALLAGAPGVTALGIARHRGARILFGQLLIGAACSVEALRAPLDPYDEAVGRLAEDSELSQVLGRLGEALRGSSEDRQQGQAPVSFRVIPQVLTHLGRTIGRFGEDVRRALRAVTDSPAYLEGRFLTNGGFHEIEVAAGMDSLALALIRAVELAAQRIHRLLDHRFSRLPDQLTPRPVGCGLVVVQKRAVGVVNELRRLGAPACLGLADTSLGQEDAMTFGFEAAEKLRRVEELVREILACELLVARQAWALRGGQPAAGLTAVAASIAELVDPVYEDRPLAEDLSRLVGLLERNELT